MEVSFSMGAYEETVTKYTKYKFRDKLLGEFEIEKIRGSRGTYTGTVKNNDEITKYTPSKKSKFYDMSQSARLDVVSPSRSEIAYNLPRLLRYITRSFEVDISNIF